MKNKLINKFTKKLKNWLFNTFYNQIIDACSNQIKTITQYQVVSKEAEILNYETQFNIPSHINSKHIYKSIEIKKRELLNKLYDNIDVEMFEDDMYRNIKVKLTIYVAKKF